MNFDYNNYLSDNDKKVPKITPNKDQEQALKELNKFKTSNKEEFTLSGVGGTGKTTIIRELFRTKNDDIKHSVLGMTISHKARINLSKSIPNSTTIASGMALKMEYDEFGDPYFIFDPRKMHLAPVKKAKAIVIDEASMIDEELRNYILNNKSLKTKIYYLGDHHQLKPIKSKNGCISPVFDIPGYELTQKVRQDPDDYIAELCDEIAYKIDTDCSLSFLKNIKTKFNKETKKGYSVSSYEKSLKSFISNFNDGKNVRFTAYRKKVISEINMDIRKKLFNTNDMFVVGELLIADSAYERNGETIFFNGEDLIVKNIEEVKSNGLLCYSLDIGKEYPALVVKPESYRKYYEKINELKAWAIKEKNWKFFYDFKDNFSFVSYGYAVNNYKIQGTTLDGCYVNAGDPLSLGVLCNKEKLQAIYVGCSRPKNFLAIY